jgi:transposase
MIAPEIIKNERVDDIPLLLRHMQQMGLGELLDQHFVTHGNWQGASLGTVSMVWLSHILSEGDHRLSYVEAWVAQRPVTLGQSLGQAVHALDFSDDRLAEVLRLLSDDDQWSSFEGELNRRLLRVYDLSLSRVRLDSTSASGHWQVTEEGLFQYGHSKDHRPDLPQLKVMLASLDPLGMPLVTQVVDGSRADDPLYIPAITATRASLLRSGLLYVGDTKMAAIATRGTIVIGQDYYLCPLSQVQLSSEQLQAYLKPVWAGEQALTPIRREQADGKKVHIADGFEVFCPLSTELEGQSVEWVERRLVIRSLQQAAQQKQRLQQRLNQAQQAIAALNVRKQGRKRAKNQVELEQQVQTILQQHQVADLLQLTYHHTEQQRHVRRYRDRPARIETAVEITVTTNVDQTAVEQLSRYFGWRVYATNAPTELLSLSEGLLAYRDQYRQERSFGRFKNKPLSLTPMFLHRDDHATGLVRLLSLGLRALTLMEFTVQDQLAQLGQSLPGLYPGNPKRTTNRPTAERLLKAFDQITLTLIELEDQTITRITPLSQLQKRILSLLGFSVDIYTRFDFVSQKPP